VKGEDCLDGSVDLDAAHEVRHALILAAGGGAFG
jgi:hypothetical protein